MHAKGGATQREVRAPPRGGQVAKDVVGGCGLGLTKTDSEITAAACLTAVHDSEGGRYFRRKVEEVVGQHHGYALHMVPQAAANVLSLPQSLLVPEGFASLPEIQVSLSLSLSLSLAACIPVRVSVRVGAGG